MGINIACPCRVVGLLAFCGTLWLAPSLRVEAASDWGGAPAAGASASALLAVDTNRRAIVARIVNEWGALLTAQPDGIAPAQLEKLLGAMRADQLLAASLVGTLDGLKAVVLASQPNAEVPSGSKAVEKTLGDANADLVYTPVSPCRLFDTRASQGGLGTPALNVRRTYGATTPVTNQGGPGGCVAGAGAVVALVQIGTLAPSANGLLQGGAQGAASFPNALILYQSGDQYGTAVALSLNPANGRFDLVEQFGTADLYGDLLGYFKAASGTFVQGGNSFGATAKLGTNDAKPLEVYVNNARAMRYEPDAQSPNAIGGNAANIVTTGAFGASVGGGGTSGIAYTLPSYPSITFNCSNVAGATACANRVTNVFGTVGGGVGNQAGAGTGAVDVAPYATVGGGNGNLAEGDSSTVAGGIGNHAQRLYDAVGGGSDNAATGGGSTVSGGANNTASVDFSTVAGGLQNVASGNSSTVAGGWSNTASGNESFVAGGSFNTASGMGSFAAGTHASAVGNGCFAFSDQSSSNVTTCPFANEFVVRALGGVYLFTSGTSDATYHGAFLGPNTGAWAAYSDRDGKDMIEPVDATAVLDRLVQVPIATWKWKAEDASQRHMGPMAQDFYAAFRLGADDTHIVTVDADGVALAAIQGLNAKVEAKVRAKDAEIAELRVRTERQQQELVGQQRELAELRRTVERLMAH